MRLTTLAASVALTLCAAVLATPATARADGFLALDSVFLDARSHVHLDKDFRAAAGYPTGGDVQFQLDLASQFDLTATTGFLWGIGGDQDTYHIPLLIGVVYDFGQGASTPFIAGAFGGMVTSFDGDPDWNSALDFSAGYQWRFLRLQLGATFFDVADLSNTSSVYASLGFALK